MTDGLDPVALANHRFLDAAARRAASRGRRKATARERAQRPVPPAALTAGVSLSGRRVIVPSGEKGDRTVPLVLSYVFVRVSPSCGRGRWVVQRAVSAVLGGNVILWTKGAVATLGAAPGGGDLFRVAVPRGLRPAFDGVAITVIESGVRAAHRVEFIESASPPLPTPGPDDARRVQLAWDATAAGPDDHATTERLERARRVQPYEAAQVVADFDAQRAGWLPADDQEEQG